MTTPHLPNTPAIVEQLLNRQITSCTKYLEYLEQVKQVMSDNNIDQLQKLIGNNDNLLKTVESTRQQQMEFLSTHGYEASATGLSTCIRDHAGTSSKLLELDKQLTELLKNLQSKIQLNDRIIRISQQRVKQAIRILSGHGVNTNSSVYSSQGSESSTDENSRTIAIA